MQLKWMNPAESEQNQININSTMAMEAIALSSSPEIDQSSKTLSKEDLDKKSSEVEVLPFRSKCKKILRSLSDFIIRSKRVVEDQFTLYFRRDEIERARVYHVWPGNNLFFFQGRLVCGPDPRGLLLTIISISLSSWTFIVHVASDKGNQNSTVILIIGSIMTVIVLINLGTVSASDPGIIPRNGGSFPEFGPISATIESDIARRRKVININGTEVKLKYCRICNIYRPPRSCHCAICNNCVEKFDHHCPWIGHCIGLRNYRSYIMFIFTGLVLFAIIFIFSCKRIHNKLYGDGILVSGLLRNCPETLALTAFSFAALCFLGGLCCLNAFLVTLNQTAYENFHQKFAITRNPYHKGILNNIKEGLLSSVPPPRVNFRAEVEPGVAGGCNISSCSYINVT